MQGRLDVLQGPSRNSLYFAPSYSFFFFNLSFGNRCLKSFSNKHPSHLILLGVRLGVKSLLVKINVLSVNRYIQNMVFKNSHTFLQLMFVKYTFIIHIVYYVGKFF